MYRVQYSKQALKKLQKMDKSTQKMILNWIGKHLEKSVDPRIYGKGLTANKSGQWRYRIGDYRLICNIDENKLIILAITVGHRKEVYKH